MLYFFVCKWNVLMFGMGQVAACGADEDEICYMEDENGRRIGRQNRELAGPVVRHFLF
jgi:hypothetical protein